MQIFSSLDSKHSILPFQTAYISLEGQSATYYTSGNHRLSYPKLSLLATLPKDKKSTISEVVTITELRMKISFRTPSQWDNRNRLLILNSSQSVSQNWHVLRHLRHHRFCVQDQRLP